MRITKDNIIRAKIDQDWHAILAVLHSCFAYMDARINPPSSLHELTPKDIQRHAKDEILLLVFDAAQSPIACTFLTDKPDCLYLGKLAVHPKHRGKGIAQALIDKSTEHAKSLGHSKLRFQTRIELTENHAIFAHFGFIKTATGIHAGFSQPTEITMEKQI
ncbi:MAG: GNAT family N-acetyltransferase [Amylibacter sp.]|nr:GNAT family N-acetyltransferase [Amylibacter sp.]